MTTLSPADIDAMVTEVARELGLAEPRVREAVESGLDLISALPEVTE